jgi:diacylglycerol kinase (ATP)
LPRPLRSRKPVAEQPRRPVLPRPLRSRKEIRDEARRAAPFSAARREATGVVNSLNYAFEGVIYVVRTQRNMRIHFAAALIVLILGVVLGATRFEMLALMLAVAMVLVAEMLNTALEKAIDVATSSFDPVARAAKDVAAGAVLVASVAAAFIGYLVFANRLRHPTQRAINSVRESPVHVTVIAVAIVIMLVIATKAYFGRGTPLRGGLPSGHAAVAFGGWTAVTFLTQSYGNQVLVSTLVFVMALLVAQSRVEAGIHTALEVLYGGVLGALVTAAIFQALR